MIAVEWVSVKLSLTRLFGLRKKIQQIFKRASILRSLKKLSHLKQIIQNRTFYYA